MGHTRNGLDVYSYRDEDKIRKDFIEKVKIVHKKGIYSTYANALEFFIRIEC